jgi:hypothetical protein
MNASEFEQAVSDFLDNKISEDKLCEAFYWVAERIVNGLDIKKILTDRDDYIQEAVMICFDKLPRYDREKGKAYNFFSTIILCLFRQGTQKKKNYQELKDRYKDFLNGA